MPKTREERIRDLTHKIENWKSFQDLKGSQGGRTPNHHLRMLDRNAYVLLWHAEQSAQEEAKLQESAWKQVLTSEIQQLLKVTSKSIPAYRKNLRQLQIRKDGNYPLTIMGKYMMMHEVEFEPLGELQYPKPAIPKGKYTGEYKSLFQIDYHMAEIREALYSMSSTEIFMDTFFSRATQLEKKRMNLEEKVMNHLLCIRSELETYGCCLKMKQRLARDPFTG